MADRNEEKITLEQLQAKAAEEASLRAQGDENILQSIEDAAMKLAEIDTEDLLSALREIVEDGSGRQE